MLLVRLSRGLSRMYRAHPSIRPLCTAPPHDPKGQSTAADSENVSRESSEEPKAEVDLLYDAVLLQVPAHGWTDAAIRAAVQELGWSIASARMISRGPVQVVEEFVRRCNEQLAVKLAEDSEKDDRDSPVERATYAIKERIEMIEPYHDSWAKALAMQALPKNSQKAIRSSAMLVDEIAHFSGYQKPDFSWYTDRAVLGLAYHSTELYWLTDKSTGREDTWQFLERRLKDSHALRSQANSAYTSFMTISDATIGSLSTLIRSARRSY